MRRNHHLKVIPQRFPDHCAHRQLAVEMLDDSTLLVCQDCLAVLDHDLPVFYKE